MNKNELKVGVIGSAGRGEVLATLLAKLPRAKIVACCDINSDVLERNRQQFGEHIFVTEDYRTLLERDIDAVIVATPDFLHEEHAIAALERGIAVYLEKPMAISVEGCDRVLQAAMSSGTHIYLGHNMRQMPFVCKMKEIIDAGTIGEVKACWVRHFVGHGGDFYFHDWHAEARYSNSLLLQKGSHDIDIIHWLCGGYTKRVNAMGGLTLYGDVKSRSQASSSPVIGASATCSTWPPVAQQNLNHWIDVEDLSSVQMQLDNGVFATYMQCHYTPDYWRNYVIIGTEGRMENFGNDEVGTTIKVWKRRLNYSPEADIEYRVELLDGSHGGSDERMIGEFVSYVLDGGTIQTSAIAARESVATGCMATDSIRNGGQPFNVPPVDAVVRHYFESKSEVVLNGRLQPLEYK